MTIPTHVEKHNAYSTHALVSPYPCIFLGSSDSYSMVTHGVRWWESSHLSTSRRTELPQGKKPKAEDRNVLPPTASDPCETLYFSISSFKKIPRLLSLNITTLGFQNGGHCRWKRLSMDNLQKSSFWLHTMLQINFWKLCLRYSGNLCSLTQPPLPSLFLKWCCFVQDPGSGHWESARRVRASVLRHQKRRQSRYPQQKSKAPCLPATMCSFKRNHVNLRV